MDLSGGGGTGHRRRPNDVEMQERQGLLSSSVSASSSSSSSSSSASSSSSSSNTSCSLRWCIYHCRYNKRFRLASALCCGAAVCIFFFIFFHEFWLLTWTLDDAERFMLNNPKTSPIIITLTTVPHRIESLDPLLKSLMLQTVRPRYIRLNIPKFFRQSEEYVIPARYQNRQAIRIFRTERDWGPATKFVPAVLDGASGRLESATTPLLIVDDDYLYPKEFVDLFSRYAVLYPEYALATRGWDVPRNLRWKDSVTMFGVDMKDDDAPLRVDVLTGCGAILVQPRFFNTTRLVNYGVAPKAAFFVDDVWLSGNLATQHVVRVVIPTRHRHETILLRKPKTRIGLIHKENNGGANNDAIIKYFEHEWDGPLHQAGPNARGGRSGRRHARDSDGHDHHGRELTDDDTAQRQRLRLMSLRRQGASAT